MLTLHFILTPLSGSPYNVGMSQPQHKALTACGVEDLRIRHEAQLHEAFAAALASSDNGGAGNGGGCAPVPGGDGSGRDDPGAVTVTRVDNETDPVDLARMILSGVRAVDEHRHGNTRGALDSLDSATAALAALADLIERSIKICSCGVGYSLEEWLDLPYLGNADGLDYRNCPACQTTLACLESDVAP